MGPVGLRTLLAAVSVTATLATTTLCAAAAPAGEPGAFVIGPGHEADLQAAIAPLTLDGAVGEGWLLTGISIAREKVGYRLTAADDPDAWVLVSAYHASDRSVVPGERIRQTEHCQLTLSHSDALDRKTATAVAAPLADALTSNGERLARAWSKRPADTKGRGATHGTPPPEPELVAPEPSILRDLLTADAILYAVGGLLALLILLSGLPAILRRKS